MKILSIDFDAIMFPCIKLYNDYCTGSENSTQIWNRIDFERDIQQYLKYDANVYQDIVKFIFNTVQNGAKFIPIQEHQMIVDYLKNYDLLNETFNITNIDYHHDIMYHKDSLTLIDFDNYSCADWAGYLLYKNLNTQLTWVRCPGSSYPDPQLCSFENEIIIKNISEIKNLDPDYDFVFFCLSPQWVPYQYHHLYDLVISLIQMIYPDQVETKLKPETPTLDESDLAPIKVLICKNADTGEETIVEDMEE